MGSDKKSVIGTVTTIDSAEFVTSSNNRPSKYANLIEKMKRLKPRQMLPINVKALGITTAQAQSRFQSLMVRLDANKTIAPKGTMFRVRTTTGGNVCICLDKPRYAKDKPGNKTKRVPKAKASGRKKARKTPRRPSKVKAVGAEATSPATT